jgi:hypothetical protein
MKKEKRPGTYRHSTIKSEPTLYTYEAETVAFHMVEKIISLTISNSLKNKVEKQVSKEIFTYTKSIIDTFVNSQFISIDKEEEDIKLNLPIFKEEENGEKEEIPTIETKKTKINNINDNFNIDLINPFFSNYFRGENNWNILNEPIASDIDRYSSTMINYIFPNSKVPESNLEKVEEENPNLALTNTSHFIVKKKKNKHSTLRSDLSNEQNKKKKTLAEVMSKFSFHVLPKEDFLSDDDIDLDIKELRLEKEEELKKIEKEKLQKLNELKKLEEIKKEENNLKKQYEKKKMTIDPNGNIVFIKGYKIEALSKEFLAIKSNMKMLRTETAKYDIPLDDIDINIEDESENKGNKSDREKNDKINNKKIEKSDKKEKKGKENEKEDNNKKVVVNPMDIYQKKNDRRLSVSTLERKIERGPITPSGSVFDRIKLEVGVSMKENKKFKTGGKDYFLKYNKYSLELYDKKLKDTISTNSFMNTHYNAMSNTDYQRNFNSSLDNFNNTGNNFKEGSQTSTSLFKKNNVTHNNLKSSEMNLSDLSLNPLIKLNGAMSLRSTINDLDLIDEKELMDQKLNRKNIFKERMNLTSLKKKKAQLNEMNEFTTTLLSDNRWKTGYNKQKLEPLKIPQKPLQKEIEREMGKSGFVLRNRQIHNPNFSKIIRNFGDDFRKFTSN